MSRLYYLTGILCICSCSIKTYKLQNGITKVPVSEIAYINKAKFDSSLLAKVDISSLYEEYDFETKKLKSQNKEVGRNIYLGYKFYPNGFLNVFAFRKDSLATPKDFDPLYSGYRGVYYYENSKIRFELYAEIDDRQNIGKITGTLAFTADTMFVKRDDLLYSEYYVKKKLPLQYLEFKTLW